MYLLILGLILFHGLHSIRMLAPEWRQARIDAMGEGPWKGIYSLATLLALVVIVFGYRSADPASLWAPPVWGRHLAILLILIAFVLMPFNLRSSRLAPITHHPFLLAMILWSGGHLLANGEARAVLLFGSFFVWAIWNLTQVRKRADPLPPRAPLWQDALAMMIGVAIWLLFLLIAHQWLFGVSPLA